MAYKRYRTQPLVYADALGAAFAKKIEALVKELNKELLNEAKTSASTDADPKAKEENAFDASLSARMKSKKEAFDKKNKKKIEQLAFDFAKELDDHSKMQMTKQVMSLPKVKADRLIKKLRIGDALAKKTTEITELIKSLSSGVVDRIERELQNTATLGDAKKVYDIVLESGEVSKNRAMFIAEQETRATLSAFNTERAKATGATKFEWIHSSAGLNPRPLHVSYDGRVFEFDDPPIIDERTQERGMPGELPNCRCFFRTIYEFEE